MKNVTDSSFQADVIESEIPVLVDFWAPWCGPCVALSPVLEALAEEYAGKVTIAKVNVDENPESAAKFGVRSIPFLAMMKNGEMQDSMVGAQPKAKLQSMIDKFV